MNVALLTYLEVMNVLPGVVGADLTNLEWLSCILCAFGTGDDHSGDGVSYCNRR